METKTESPSRQISPEEARRAYHRAWRKNHPDKVKKTRERFYARLAEKMSADLTSNEKE